MAILLVCWCVLSGMGGTDAQDNNASRAPFPCVVAGGRSRSALQSVSLTTVMARPEESSRIRRKGGNAVASTLIQLCARHWKSHRMTCLV